MDGCPTRRAPPQRLESGRMPDPPEELPRQARPRAARPSPRATRARSGPGGALRDPGAPRQQPALGPAPGARRRAGVVGAAQGSADPPGREPPGGAHRGPPARVPRLPRRDPGRAPTAPGRWRSGTRGTYETREVPRRRGDRDACTASACSGPLRAVPDQGQELDDPPDGPAGRPGGEPMPEAIAPMLARARASCPRDDSAYGYEVKWDGVRAVAHVDAGHVTLTGRNGTDFTSRYPELRGLATALGSRRLILDGEVVAFDSRGPAELRAPAVADAPGLGVRGQAPHARRAGDLRGLRPALARGPLHAWRCPTRDRRRLLAALELDGPALADARPPRGRRRGAAGGQRGAGAGGDRGQAPGLAVRAGPPLVGAGSRSRTARRRRSWSAAGCRGEGRRARPRSARWPWASTTTGGLLYAGKVGSGFTEATLAATMRELEPLRRDDSPFDGRQPPRGTLFVEPRLVAQVRVRGVDPHGTLRAPVVQGPAPRRRSRGRRARGLSATALAVASARPGTGTVGAWHARSGAGRSHSAS